MRWSDATVRMVVTALLCGCDGHSPERQDAGDHQHPPVQTSDDGDRDGTAHADADRAIDADRDAETDDAGWIDAAASDAFMDDAGGEDAGVTVLPFPTGDPALDGWPYLVPDRIVALGDGLRAYNPHVDLGYTHRGTGHEHAAPDHSGIACAVQEQRLRDLPGRHAQDFAWLTAHTFVAPDPAVDGILHMFGVEVYVAEAASGEWPHMIALLPDGRLAGESGSPFGNRELSMAAFITRVVAEDGLPALAHPSRYSPTLAEVNALDRSLWAIEAVSGGSDIDRNLAFIDARLTAGRYTCLGAGSDAHGEDYWLTAGYQVVSTPSATPVRSEIFEEVRACNFFACRTFDGTSEPIEEPALTVEGGELRFRAGATVDRIDFVGQGGTVLRSVTGVAEATYRPTAADLYVRVSAHRESGAARCLSQPVWILGAP